MGVLPLIPAPEALAARVSRERAVALLAGGAARRSMRWALGQQLRSIALLYIPYYVYAVSTGASPEVKPSFYAADAVTGAFDPYELGEGLDMQAVPPEAARNTLPATLDPEKGALFLRDRLLRVIYRRGFFRAGNLRLRVTPTSRSLLVPYWAGFYGNGGQAAIRVMDGVRGTFEGAKVRETVLQWLNS